MKITGVELQGKTDNVSEVYSYVRGYVGTPVLEITTIDSIQRKP